MKCPYRLKVKVSHKSGEQVTEEEWQNCYETLCPVYDDTRKTCKRLDLPEIEPFPLLPISEFVEENNDE